MNAKRALIRADASIDIGTGHISRCRTLASALRRRGWGIAFACRRTDGDLTGALAAAGETVLELPGNLRDEKADAETVLLAAQAASFSPDWVVVDHYDLGSAWEQVVRSDARVFVIDDLADRVHDCDLLLDQNPSGDGAGRYRPLVPGDCRVLSGLQFALLREEFKRLGAAVAPKSGRLERVLVFYGGSDPTGETMKALTMLAHSKKALSVDVVVGAANPARAAIETFCREREWTFHSPAARMADLMAGADLSFGAAGTTAWERCATGLPTIVTVVAENQRRVATELVRRGAALAAGSASEVSAGSLEGIFRTLCGRPDEIRRMSEAALKVVPEPGSGPDKVAAAMEEKT